MKIHSPSFSGSIIQDRENAYADLSGSFTGSFTGEFTGEITVEAATFDDLIVNNTLTLGNDSGDIQLITGSMFLSGGLEVDGDVNVINGGEVQIQGVNVLDTALAFAIALG